MQVKLFIKRKTKQVEARSREMDHTSKGIMDMLSLELERTASKMGVDVNSEQFQATWLLACEYLDKIRIALLQVDRVEDREIGAYFIEGAMWRLLMVGMWGQQDTFRNLSLEDLPPLGEDWTVDNLMGRNP